MKLSNAQRKVMQWMWGGWQPFLDHGCAVYVNGKRVCNTDTMRTLGKDKSAIYWRIKSGWSLERAILEPIHVECRNKA